MQDRARVNITHHAKMRLKERFPNIHHREYQQFVSAARYNGLSLEEVNNKDSKKAFEIMKRFYYNKSTKLKLYKNAIFIFAGNNHKGRTLLTVINI